MRYKQEAAMFWTPSVVMQVPILDNACEGPACKVEFFFRQNCKSRLIISRICQLAKLHLLSLGKVQDCFLCM